MGQQKAFTLIELVVTIGIIGILSAIILFSTAQYINKSKDANIKGNLAVLISAGEAYYGAKNDSYEDFCDSPVVQNSKNQMPQNLQGPCYSESNKTGMCCYVNENKLSWAACAREFTDTSKAFCVDSRGVQKEIENSLCNSITSKCP
jgi:prepilin-type N-terminal cleavage/methylation domain-containing protein